MLASKHFQITRTTEDDWFDPVLGADTKLFVDPFLVFKETESPWDRAHDLIVQHFQRVFMLIGQGNLNPNSTQYRKAIDLFLAPEPKELCLGYTARGITGAGGGYVYAKLMAAAAADAIRRGLDNPKHFEELGVFNKGIGSDRISDIASTILKRELIAYTQRVAKRHPQLGLSEHALFAATFDEQRERWQTTKVLLPTNPVSGGPLLLVPERFLQELPAINADDWWSYFENERLRNDLNYTVMGSVDKETIIEAARNNPESVRRYSAAKESQSANPYDLDADPSGVWQWDAATQEYVRKNPIAITSPIDEAQFLEVLRTIVKQFKHFVEQQKGWYLLWDGPGRREKPELAVQLLFRGIAQYYCIANNISLDAEVNLGVGPVDFKFSNGYTRRAHLEVKKLHNGKFWNGLERQLPAYMRSDNVKHGWLLSVRYRDGKKWDTREREIPIRVEALQRTEGLAIEWCSVDARNQPSASTL